MGRNLKREIQVSYLLRSHLILLHLVKWILEEGDEGRNKELLLKILERVRERKRNRFLAKKHVKKKIHELLLVSFQEWLPQTFFSLLETRKISFIFPVFFHSGSTEFSRLVQKWSLKEGRKFKSWLSLEWWEKKRRGSFFRDCFTIEYVRIYRSTWMYCSYTAVSVIVALSFFSPVLYFFPVCVASVYKSMEMKMQMRQGTSQSMTWWRNRMLRESEVRESCSLKTDQGSWRSENWKFLGENVISCRIKFSKPQVWKMSKKIEKEEGGVTLKLPQNHFWCENQTNHTLDSSLSLFPQRWLSTDDRLGYDHDDDDLSKVFDR